MVSEQRTVYCPRCPDRPPVFHAYTLVPGPDACDYARRQRVYWCAECEQHYGAPA